MFHQTYHYTFTSRWSSSPTTVTVNLFLFDPAHDEHDLLLEWETTYPQLKAIYKKSRHVLLFTHEDETNFSFKLVELGPRGLSATQATLRKNMEEVRTEAASLLQNHARTDAFSALDSLRNLCRSVKVFDFKYELSPEILKDLVADTGVQVDRFCQYLDPDVLRVMELDSLSLSASQRMYNWISLSKARRLQAVRDYPRFAPLFVEIDDSSDYELSVLLDVAGGSLEDFLCEQFRIRKATFRHLNKMPSDQFIELKLLSELREQLSSLPRNTSYRVRDIYAARPLSMAMVLDALPAHHFPRESDDWKMLVKIAEDIFKLSKSAGHYDFGVVAGVDRYLGDVVDNYTRYLNARSSTSQVVYQESIGHVKHALDSFVEMVIMPTVATTGMVKKNSYPAGRGGTPFARLQGSVQKVFTMRGMKDVYEFSRLWHEQSVGDRVTTGVSTKTRQELLLPWAFDTPWTSADGYRFEPLRYFPDVREEGRVMKHCIGSMSDQCLKGQYLVFRVFGPDGFRATTTVRPGNSSGRYTYHAIEFYDDGWLRNEEGRKVKRVAAPKDVAMMLVRHLNEQEFPLQNCPETKRFLVTDGNWRTQILDAPEAAQEIADANFEVFLPLLPKRLRSGTPIDLIEGPFFTAVEPIMKKAWSRQIDVAAAA